MLLVHGSYLSSKEEINSIGLKILIIKSRTLKYISSSFSPSFSELCQFILKPSFGQFYSFPLTEQEVNRERCKPCRITHAQQRKQRGLMTSYSLCLLGGGKWYCLFPGMVCQTGMYYHSGNGSNTNRDTRDQGWMRDWSQQMARYRQDTQIDFLPLSCEKVSLCQGSFP